MIFLNNLTTTQIIVICLVVCYIVTYFVVRTTQRGIRKDYSWAVVMGNFVFAFGGPIAIFVCIIASMEHAENRSFYFKTKPPKWL